MQFKANSIPDKSKTIWGGEYFREVKINRCVLSEETILHKTVDTGQLKFILDVLTNK